MSFLKLYINPDLLIYFSSSGIRAVDAYQQKEFLIEEVYLKRLAFWNAQQEESFLTAEDEELLKANLLLKERPEKEWQGDILSYITHRGSRNSPLNTPQQTDEEVFKECFLMSEGALEEVSNKEPLENSTDEEAEILLPSIDESFLQDKTLLFSLKERFTSRQFYEAPIKLEALSALLFWTFGNVHGKNWPELEEAGVFQFGRRTTSPSATGLAATEAYVTALNVEGLLKGLYKYQAATHSLKKIKEDISQKELSSLLKDQFWAKELPCGIFLVCDLEKVWLKDSKNRGYISAYLEAGHFSQTLLLLATAFNMQTWMTGTFRDEEVSQILSLQSSRFATFYIGFGYGAKAPLPKFFKERLSSTLF